MIIGQTSDRLEFLSSTPSQEINLTITGKGINFNPQSIQFIPEAGKVQIKRHTRVTVFQQGVLEVNYAISGGNSEDYEPLESDVLVVSPLRNVSKQIDLKKVDGCHRIVLYKCANSDDKITARSTSPWSKYNNNLFTTGIVNIHSKQVKRPLSIAGINLPVAREQNDIIDPSLANETCDSFAQNDISLPDLAETRAQENAYASAIYNRLPKWLNISFPIDGNPYSPYSYQLSSSLLSGKQLKELLNGYKNSLTDNELYSVQFASSEAKLTVGNDSINIPKYQKSAPITLATELCGSSTNLTLIVLPFQSKDLIYELQTLKRLRSYGCNILPRSIQLLRNLKIPCQTYFNGTAMEEKGISQGNLAMQVEINKQVIVSDSFNSTLEFNGTSTAEVGDLSKVSKR